MILARRSFLIGLGAAFAAPAIVRASSLMPVKLIDHREFLSDCRMFYVRIDGSDNSGGLINTPEGAFRTIQRALDACEGSGTVHVGPGVYYLDSPLVRRSISPPGYSGRLVSKR